MNQKVFCMRHKIRRFLSILITESWTIIWDDEAAPPPVPEPGSNVIQWNEGEAAPETVVLRRNGDGSGWRVESGQ